MIPEPATAALPEFVDPSIPITRIKDALFGSLEAENLDTPHGRELLKLSHYYFLNLALCHTVLHQTIDGKTSLSATSPDELALVCAAELFGYEFSSRPDSSHIVMTMKEDFSKKMFPYDGSDDPDWRRDDGKPHGVTFEVLDTLNFDNNRRRMSVIVRMPTSLRGRKESDSLDFPWPQDSDVLAGDGDYDVHRTSGILLLTKGADSNMLEVKSASIPDQ